MTPKAVGADFELGNFILGVNDTLGTGPAAARALLAEFGGRGSADVSAPAPASSPSWSSRWSAQQPANPQDWGRRYLANGGVAYIDSDHLELGTAITRSAYDQAACVHAMLRLAQGAVARANARQPRGRSIQVLVNNSDGSGHSYGSHLNFLVSRAAWDDLFCRRLQFALYLSAFQVSSIVWSGQGKVGSEHGRTPAEFQLSQRADFFETAMPGPQTTFNRPLCNSRDESLCGSGVHSAEDRARLHVIFFDNTLCHVSTVLKLGVMQVVLSMIEAAAVNRGLLLDDPIDALSRWSRDPALSATAALGDGRRVTALDLQWNFFEEASRFVEDGGCDDAVPRVGEVMGLWERTLTGLGRDPDSVAGSVDWVLKRSILRRAVERRPGLTTSALKHLDHLYSSLDPAEGFFWACEREGIVERLFEGERVEWFCANPPDDTRAWTRGRLLGHADARAIIDVDWDRVVVRGDDGGRWRASRTLHLSDPLRWSKQEAEPLIEGAATLEEILDRIEETDPLAVSRAATGPHYVYDWTHRNGADYWR
jgi:Pup amidohydrolase